MLLTALIESQNQARGRLCTHHSTLFPSQIFLLAKSQGSLKPITDIKGFCVLKETTLFAKGFLEPLKAKSKSRINNIATLDSLIKAQKSRLLVDRIKTPIRAISNLRPREAHTYGMVTTHAL